MTNDFNPELLSAYLDDECTPDEKHSVEALLAVSPELREELDSLRAVSKSVRSLPREQAPDHLVAAVMQSLEREHLLGPPSEVVQRDASEVTRIESTPALPSRTPRTLWTTGIAATALVVCSVLVLWDRDNNDLRMELASDLGTPEVIHPETPAPFGSEPDLFDKMIESDGAAAGGFGVSGAAASTRPGEADAFPAAAAVSDAGLQFPAPLSGAEVGDVIEAFQRKGDDVVVVKLTVVDRQAGLQKLQLVLARHLPVAAQTAASNDESGLSKNSPDKDTKNPGAASDLLIAVLAEMPESELAETIAELRRDTQIGGLDVATGISNEALGSYAVSVDGIDVAAADNNGGRFLQGTTPSPTIGARSLAGNDESEVGQRRSGGRSERRQESRGGVRTLLLKPELLKRNAAETAIAESGSSTQPTESLTATHDAEVEKPAARRPILFVLVDQPDRPATSPKPAPDAKNDEQGAS